MKANCNSQCFDSPLLHFIKSAWSTASPGKQHTRRFVDEFVWFVEIYYISTKPSRMYTPWCVVIVCFPLWSGGLCVDYVVEWVVFACELVTWYRMFLLVGVEIGSPLQLWRNEHELRCVGWCRHRDNIHKLWVSQFNKSKLIGD